MKLIPASTWHLSWPAGGVCAIAASPAPIIRIAAKAPTATSEASFKRIAFVEFMIPLPLKVPGEFGEYCGRKRSSGSSRMCATLWRSAQRGSGLRQNLACDYASDTDPAPVEHFAIQLRGKNMPRLRNECGQNFA